MENETKEKVIKGLMEYPEMLKKVETQIFEGKNLTEDYKKEKEVIELNTLNSIIAETDENGKKVYSNETKRKTELFNRLNNNKEYTELINKISTLKTETDKLILDYNFVKRKFRAMVSIARVIGDN